MGAIEKVHPHHHRHPGLSFHYRHEHIDNHNHQANKIPKGCVTLLVGQEEEEQEKVLVPVSYINHPLFAELLKEAEEEYGYAQKGPITIPCRVDEFKFVQDLIDKDQSLLNRHHHHVWCFGA